MILPTSIKNSLESEVFFRDETGLSGSEVYLLQGQVLKIQEDNEEARNEEQIMRWLKGRLPVPQVIACESSEGKNYLLMSRLGGKMACDEEYMREPQLLTELLANALKLLWQVDVGECPCQWNLDRKLAWAGFQVEHGMVDLEHVEPDTYGENGFASPKELHQWLVEHKPQEELVLSHGDFTLPNLFFEGGVLKGYIDLGRAGRADRWQDIALCYRSLLHNYEGKYGGRKWEGYHPELLFEKLGIEPDWEKIKYYLLLDELF